MTTTQTLDTVDTVVVGAGHAGLAVSRLLTGAGREHVVLDRGRVGERWRTERWDSLHLLTPSWMTRLPGWYYAGADPEGFLSAGQLVRSLEGYARSFDAPVLGGTTVLSVTPHGLDRYDVVTDRGTWRTRHVVVATGPHGNARVPAAVSGAVDADVVTSNRYRNPGRLAPGGVLVVGASSSGVQIADELARAGRDVVLAVGRHTRMPRRYRGMDIFWWLDATGRLARTIDEVADPEAARREPSLQLVGRNGTADDADRDLDLATLQGRGVRLAGRLTKLSGRVATFADDLAGTVGAADRSLQQLLDRIDQHVDHVGLTAEVWAPHRPRPVALPRTSQTPRRLDLAAEGIGTVVLATGFTPDLGWLDLPVVGRDGWIEQHRGVTAAPGVYVVGQRFQHRRDSGFIDGARHDAHTVVHHLLTGSLSEGAPTPTDEERAA